MSKNAGALFPLLFVMGRVLYGLSCDWLLSAPLLRRLTNFSLLKRLAPSLLEMMITPSSRLVCMNFGELLKSIAVFAI
ncbi:MAG TPA: hypothetical protein VLE50_12785 [Cellvibrio sp.]|nr:hypothetical protein [Cellvibrio sp.]